MSANLKSAATIAPPRQKDLNILFAISEADPLVKIGGLGDVGGALPLALSRIPPEQLGGVHLNIRLILPYHTPLKNNLLKTQWITNVKVPTAGSPVKAQVYQTSLGDLPVYLIDGAPVSDLSSVYGDDPVKMAEKFTFFSLASLRFIRKLKWPVDVLHAHDWHAALFPYGIETLFKVHPVFKNTLKIISIHNLPYLGEKSAKVLQHYLLPPSTDENLPDWARLLPFPLGLQASDRIIAVSPTYAREILTPEFGSGLEGFLKTRADQITGILNGIDTSRWNPSTDDSIARRFSVESIADRRYNRAALLAEFDLAEDPNIPLLTIIGRLDYQKGVDLALEALQQIATQPWQLIILGTGNSDLEKVCRDLQAKYPQKVRAVIRFDAALSRRLYAGADMLLMPSRYEPCGLAQMIAMRYGCIPIGRATGGLKDTIQDASSAVGTGFLFKEASAASLLAALNIAFQRFKDKATWLEMQKRGMKQDFSWEKSSYEYAKIYLNKGVGGR
ncbi:MAG: glycogen synthase [Anaerolineae bacterium]|nr:glycogen synthase [Anaerolineae bacterium]